MDYRFPLIEKLPPYVFAVINQLKMEARHKGEDIIDMGMGNPDLATPDPIVNKLVEAARNPRNHWQFVCQFRGCALATYR